MAERNRLWRCLVCGHLTLENVPEQQKLSKGGFYYEYIAEQLGTSGFDSDTVYSLWPIGEFLPGKEWPLPESRAVSAKFVYEAELDSLVTVFWMSTKCSYCGFMFANG